ncbi:guanylate-binding protein 1-like isoform X2 [Mercenaria mercenaria]|uniref:guanylate-binding protein 1-like isoform X2 n=1 Tax=Mercenaria mercenaria TaxID=6596 RepID=UPI00234EEF66|nr:guanylate-binding protein 1-like isoform X2 [Mercenaria mercenaria]
MSDIEHTSDSSSSNESPAHFEQGSSVEQEMLSVKESVTDRPAALKVVKTDDQTQCSLKSTQQLTTKTSTDFLSKYGGLKVFRSPLCLIKNDKNGQLSLEMEVIEEISKIEETVNVKAIAGPYRSGKSYLLNRLANAEKGFPLGNTTDATTKGIWVWCLEHPKRKGEVLLLLDTEGIGDVAKGDDENDNNILSLTTLLTGTFVYNMLGVLDEKLLKRLSFVTKLSKQIALCNSLAEENLYHIPEIGFYFPSFVLCLRDFSLEMVNGETPDDYLEKCLKIKKGNEAKGLKYNAIRVSILQHFQNRKCFVFDRPAGRKMLGRLEELKETELSAEFVEDTSVFLEYMYKCEPKKLMDGSLLNGRMFSCLVEKYTEAICSGDLPCIDDALTIMSRQENQ